MGSLLYADVSVIHIWSGGNLGLVTQMPFPLSLEAPNKIWLWLAKRFPRRYLQFWTHARGTPDHGYTCTISSPGESSAQVS